MKTMTMRNFCRLTSLLGIAGCVFLAVWGVRSGIFASRQALEETVAAFGVLGALLFVLLQAVQVVVPILPGGVSCLAGVLLFGAVKGFWYNYIGICIGSMLAFSFAKSCGRPLLLKLFGENLFKKYDGWTADHKRFGRLFALAIFLPVAPDDFLCYLAGTTDMSWRRFAGTILLGKPFAILLYSLLLHTAWSRFFFVIK